jgi:RHS repeat-associated protein
LDDQAQIISYEEYTPYGSTSYQAVRSQTETPKRYRYTGKERDEESGLAYHGARYLAPWLGRWTSCDPSGLVDGFNLFVFVANNSLKLTDESGLGSDDNVDDNGPAEHTKNARPSTKGKHEKGQERAKRERQKAKEKREEAERQKKNDPRRKETDAERTKRLNREKKEALKKKAEEERQQRKKDLQETERQKEERKRKEAEERAKRRAEAEERQRAGREKKKPVEPPVQVPKPDAPPVVVPVPAPGAPLPEPAPVPTPKPSAQRQPEAIGDVDFDTASRSPEYDIFYRGPEYRGSFDPEAAKKAMVITGGAAATGITIWTILEYGALILAF